MIPDPARSSLVETDWLAAHLHDPTLRIVDMCWRGDGSGRQMYQVEHIPGAVYLDWALDLSDTAGGVRYLLLPPDRFAGLMSMLGIGDETRVIAYAESDGSGAARLWWALRYYGHDQVSILNGGLTKWLAEKRPLSRDTPQFARSHFTPRPQAHWLATAAEIEQALTGAYPAVRLVDTRPPEQYAGWAVWTPEGSLYLPAGQEWVDVGGRLLRGGRIPGAVHLHACSNLDPTDWTYLRPEVIRERVSVAGVHPEHRVITYCGAGISASLGLFAFHLAGYPNLALYDASWEEWGADPARPLVREQFPISD